AQLHHERRRLAALRSRPVLADRGAVVRAQRVLVAALRDRSRHRVDAGLHRARDHATYLRAQLRTLSPQSTLDRGYAIVRRADSSLVLDPAALDPGELLHVRVAHGGFAARADEAALDAHPGRESV
ncbi:MAG: exodeoxyribonuclease VII large subunit, partial [Dermatophilaceae bacterium]